MQNLVFPKNQKKDFNILCLGAHCDDIEIGCGGTLLKLIEQYDNINIWWVVFASNEVRKKEAQASAELFLERVSQKKVTIFDYKDAYLKTDWKEIKQRFEEFKGFDPDVIFTHYRDDRHQDHRMLNELTWNTFRNHLILEYEILKYDGDLGNPNVFVPLEPENLEKKKDILIKCFESQLDKQWFDESLLYALPRIRGVHCNAETRYAEAFYVRKLSIS